MKGHSSRQNCLILLDTDPVHTGSRMLEKIKSLLCSGAMISMQPSDSEPACISKRNRLRNKQSDSRFSLLSINVVCGHVLHWKHLLNWQLRLPKNSVFWNLCSQRQDVQVCVWWSSIIFIAATHCAKHKSNPQQTISGALQRELRTSLCVKNERACLGLTSTYSHWTHARTTPAHNLKEGT